MGWRRIRNAIYYNQIATFTPYLASSSSKPARMWCLTRVLFPALSPKARKTVVHENRDGFSLCSSTNTTSGEGCRRKRMGGYEFCRAHILEDPKAPFKACDFVARTGKFSDMGKPCSRPVPLDAEDTRYCFYHKNKFGIMKDMSQKKREASSRVKG